MSFQEKLESGAVANRLRKYAGVQGPLDGAIRKIVHQLVSDITLRPTDLQAVMGKLEVDGPTSDADLLFSGELRRENGRLHIYHRPDLGSGRLRFTIGHELGHAIVARTGPRCPQRGEVVERICDKIAAEILMPAFELLQNYQAKPSIGMVHDLAKSYEVSRSAAARRIAHLWKVAVLEVEQGKVMWRSGISAQHLAGADSVFQESVVKAMQGQSGCEVVSFTLGSRWITRKMEWVCFGKGQHALFLITN